MHKSFGLSAVVRRRLRVCLELRCLHNNYPLTKSLQLLYIVFFYLFITFWGGNISKMFCKTFSESSLGCCKHGNFQKTC